MMSPKNDNFGQRLRTLRRQAGLTQKEFAMNLSVSAQIVSNWERNYTTGITPERMALIAEVLDVSLGQLLGDKPVENDLPPKAVEELENFKQYLRYKYQSGDDAAYAQSSEIAAP